MSAPADTRAAARAAAAARRTTAYATKVIVDWTGSTHPADADDPTLSAILSGCSRRPRPDWLPAIRDEVRRLYDTHHVRPAGTLTLRIADGAFARQVSAQWAASGPIGSRNRGIIRASEVARRYADMLLGDTTRDSYDAGLRAAAGLTYDEIVDLERALATRKQHGTYPAVLDAVESQRQRRDIDDPDAYARHLGQLPATEATS